MGAGALQRALAHRLALSPVCTVYQSWQPPWHTVPTIEGRAMMNGSIGGWYSGMDSGGWMFGVLILVVVIIAAAVVISRRK
jgi:hypothetical protein